MSRRIRSSTRNAVVEVSSTSPRLPVNPHREPRSYTGRRRPLRLAPSDGNTGPALATIFRHTACAARVLGTTHAFRRSLAGTNLITPHRSESEHRRYSRRRLSIAARAPLGAACRIINLEEETGRDPARQYRATTGAFAATRQLACLSGRQRADAGTGLRVNGRVHAGVPVNSHRARAGIPSFRRVRR